MDISRLLINAMMACGKIILEIVCFVLNHKGNFGIMVWASKHFHCIPLRSIMIPNNFVHADPTGLGYNDVNVNSFIIDKGVAIKTTLI